MVDPRVLEKSLDASPSISRSAVIGNNFLRGAAQFLCALVELRHSVPPGAQSTNMDISRAIRAVNRELAPPLRINWTRVLILEEGQTIPINRKGLVWRKKLEALYGYRVALLLSTPSSSDVIAPSALPSQASERAVRDIVLDVVANGLHHSSEILELNAESTFAEVTKYLSSVHLNHDLTFVCF